MISQVIIFHYLKWLHHSRGIYQKKCSFLTQIRIFLSWNQSGLGEEFAEQNFFDHRYDGDGCLFVKGWPHCWLSGDGERPNLQLKYIKIMFCSFHFGFLVTFGDEVSKIRKYYVIFVYILQGKMGKTKKPERKSHI